MENPKNVKRSIRIPKEINQKLKVIAMENNKSINKLILEIIKDWIYWEKELRKRYEDFKYNTCDIFLCCVSWEWNGNNQKAEIRNDGHNDNDYINIIRSYIYRKHIKGEAIKMESIDISFIVAIVAFMIISCFSCIYGILAIRYEFYEKALNYAIETNSTLEIR